MRQRLAVTLFAALFSAAPGLAQQAAESIEQLVERYDTTDSFSRKMAHVRFEQTFAPGERAEALVRLWRAARAADKQDAPASILGYLVTQNGKQIETTPQILAMLREAAGSANVDTRGVALNVLALHDPSKSELLRFLKDRDDFLRERAIEEIRTRSDARTRLRSYIALNRRNKMWAKSVARAQFFLAQMERNR